MTIKSPLEEKDLKTILTKMCEMVGTKYEMVDFTAKQWFWTHTWTQEDEDEFIQWLARFFEKKYFKGNYRGMKHSLYEAKKFTYNYGWKVEEKMKVDFS